MTRVAIVGAGVFGVSAAIELRARGYAVTVVDPGPLPHPAASSTDISKAVRADYDDAFYLALAERAWDGWQRWNHAWPDPPLRESGVVLFAARAMTAETWEGRVCARLEAAGYPVERLDGRIARERFPALALEPDVEGYFNARAGWVPSGAVMIRLIETARAAGARFRPEVRVRAIEEEDTGAVVITPRERIDADVVVVSAGAWTGALVPAADALLPCIAQPVVHLRVDDPVPFAEPHLPVWAIDLTGAGWYGFPALDDGTLKVGNHGPGVPVAADAPGDVSADEESACRDFLSAAMPTAARAPRVGGRRCRYCDAAGGDFVVDRVPDRSRTFVAAGGSGHAFKFAPVLGELVADAIEGCGEARFGWRAPARSVRK